MNDPVVTEAIKEAQELFTGWTDEIEPIFESIIPLYLYSARRLTKAGIKEGKYKIINRETGKEFTQVYNPLP